jgi:hypothetical protein
VIEVTAAESRDASGGLRPLAPLEERVIRSILIDGCPGVRQLRAQLDVTSVAGNWVPVGSPSIDLVVADGAPSAPLSESVLPINAHVYSGSDEFLGELIVWLSNGKLSALEYAWVTDSMPSSLPSVEMLRLSLKGD